MSHYSGFRLGVFGIILLCQISPTLLPTPRVSAASQRQAPLPVEPASSSVQSKGQDPKTDTHTRDIPRHRKNDANRNINDPKSDINRNIRDAKSSEKNINPPSPKKIALIKKLLRITNQRKSSELQLEAMLANMEETLPQVLAQIMGDRAPLEGQDLLQQVTTTTQRLVKRYRELLPTRINFGDVTEEISTNLYAKYYTEQEIQDLIDFYKTPTGQKTIATLPELTNEALQQSNAILLPEITQLMQEIMQEEFGSEPFPPNLDQEDDPNSPDE